jgi:hypothetical protein
MEEKSLNLLKFVIWLTGVIVSLTVGFAMAEGSLTIGFLNGLGLSIVTIIAGWIVVLTTVISVALALFKK